jgi:hypothetical protein
MRAFLKFELDGGRGPKFIGSNRAICLRKSTGNLIDTYRSATLRKTWLSVAPVRAQKACFNARGAHSAAQKHAYCWERRLGEMMAEQPKAPNASQKKGNRPIREADIVHGGGNVPFVPFPDPRTTAKNIQIP